MKLYNLHKKYIDILVNKTDFYFMPQHFCFSSWKKEDACQKQIKLIYIFYGKVKMVSCCLDGGPTRKYQWPRDYGYISDIIKNSNKLLEKKKKKRE